MHKTKYSMSKSTLSSPSPPTRVWKCISLNIHAKFNWWWVQMIFTYFKFLKSKWEMSSKDIHLPRFIIFLEFNFFSRNKTRRSFGMTFHWLWDNFPWRFFIRLYSLTYKAASSERELQWTFKVNDHNNDAVAKYKQWTTQA